MAQHRAGAAWWFLQAGCAAGRVRAPGGDAKGSFSALLPLLLPAMCHHPGGKRCGNVD